MTWIVRCGVLSALAVAVVGVLSASAQVASNNAAAGEVKSANERYIKAVLTGDGASFSAVTTDDFLFVNNRGAQLKRDEVIATWKSGEVKYQELKTLEESIRVRGDVAVVTGILAAKGIASGQPFDRTVRFVRVFAKTPEGWLAMHTQTTPKS